MEGAITKQPRPHDDGTKARRGKRVQFPKTCGRCQSPRGPELRNFSADHFGRKLRLRQTICRPGRGGSARFSRPAAIAFALALLAAAPLLADDPAMLATKHPLLRNLTPADDTLPAGCTKAEFPAEWAAIEGFRNFSITANPRAFLIVDEKLPEAIDARHVTAMYVGSYRERNDVGIVAWAFTSHDSAA